MIDLAQKVYHYSPELLEWAQGEEIEEEDLTLLLCEEQWSLRDKVGAGTVHAATYLFIQFLWFVYEHCILDCGYEDPLSLHGHIDTVGGVIELFFMAKNYSYKSDFTLSDSESYDSTMFFKTMSHVISQLFVYSHVNDRLFPKKLTLPASEKLRLKKKRKAYQKNVQ